MTLLQSFVDIYLIKNLNKLLNQFRNFEKKIK